MLLKPLPRPVTAWPDRGCRTDMYGSYALGDVIVGVGGTHVAGVEDLLAAVEQWVAGPGYGVEKGDGVALLG